MKNESEESILAYLEIRVLELNGNKEDFEQIKDEILENGYTTVKEVEIHLQNYYL